MIKYSLTMSAILMFAGRLVFADSMPTYTVKSRALDISFALPQGWFVVASIDPPVLFSFPPTAMLPQGELPKHGATITFSAVPTVLSCSTIDDKLWRERDLRVHNAQDSVVSHSIRTTYGSFTRMDFVEPSLTIPPQNLSIVTFYIHTVADRCFSMSLKFNQHDNEGTKWSSVAQSMVLKFKAAN